LVTKGVVEALEGSQGKFYKRLLVFFLEVKIVDWVMKRKLRRLFMYELENKKHKWPRM
jgi:hypothetical protein